MKVAYIDFKEAIATGDIILDNYRYIKEYNRAVIDGVVQVLYEGDALRITFRAKRGTRTTRDKVFNIKNIKKMAIN